MQQNSQVVKLNVGGKKYGTTIATLTQDGDNFFTTLIKNHEQTIKDSKYIFIDRDADYFRFILNYLRQPLTWTIPTNIDIEMLKHEADFYGLTNLLIILNKSNDFVNKYGMYNGFAIRVDSDTFNLWTLTTTIEKDFGFEDIKNGDITDLCYTISNYINKFNKIGYQFISTVTMSKRTVYLFKAK
jgi:hypothetical protein